MTHAAAATPATHVPRRRPSAPAAWERAGAASGVVGAIALVIAMCILSSTPSVDSTPEAVRAYLSDHYTVAMSSAYSMVVGALLLVPFLASLRTFTALAGLVLANARAIATTQRRPDRWLIRLDIEIAVLAAAASVASFVDRGRLAPGEPIAAVPWFLVALWVLALAGTIMRGDHSISEEGS